jgi:hypothetical protein
MDVDPLEIAQAGWAVVFAADVPAAVRAALQPLIDHRHARVPPDRRKVLEYRPGESREAWLGKYGARGADVVPTRVPYYVLLIGGPEAIPFDFQYLLDIEYAVGRLAFDSPEQYARYAESLIAYETIDTVPNVREVVFWSPRHPQDRVTELLTDYLITPLSEGLKNEPPIPAVARVLRYRSRSLVGPEATKAQLSQVLGAPGPSPPPALAFGAAHGVTWPDRHERRLTAQGALLCQDWPGTGPPAPEHYFAASDVADDARVHGLVAFFLASCAAGTPAPDPVRQSPNGDVSASSQRPFVAALPQRLLTHRQGGALAVIGPAGRAWAYSFRPQAVDSELIPFRNCVGRILRGEPVGHTTKDFGQAYAVRSTEVLRASDSLGPNPPPSDITRVARNWVGRNATRNYVVLGDPAARIRADLLS